MSEYANTDKTSVSDVQDNAMMIPSVAYNGTQISKIDLINYLYELVDLKKKIEEYKKQGELRYQQQEQLTQDLQRRYFRMPPDVQKPCGLGRLSAKKRREYQAWLAAAPQRERERQRLIEEEDRRIAETKEKIDQLIYEGFADTEQMKRLCDQYTALLQRHIIPPDYRTGNIPQQLLTYLFNGRTHTLTDAINLYHEELHRSNMQQIAQKQQMQAERAYSEQKSMAWQQMQMQIQMHNQQLQLQRQQLDKLEEITEEVEATRRAAEGIKFYAEMEYYSNL